MRTRRGGIIEDHDLDLRIGRQPRDPGFRHREGKPIRDGTPEQTTNPFVASLQRDERTGVQRQTTRWGPHLMRPVAAGQSPLAGVQDAVPISTG